MTYELKDASFHEYAKYCASAGIAPVSLNEFTWDFFIAFCNTHGIKHSAITELG